MTIEFLISKIDAAANPRRIEVLRDLQRDNPEAFREYEIQYRALHRTVPGKFNETQLIKLDAQVRAELTRKGMFDAGYGICRALSGIATLTRSQNLTRSVEVGRLSIDFGRQFSNITTDLAKFKMDLARITDPIQKESFKTAAFASFGSATLMLAGIGMQLVGSFLQPSGPSFEEVLFEALQIISDQIAALHEEMLREFNKVHEHLELIHKSVLESTRLLYDLIRNEVRGFRNDAVQRLETILARLNAIFQILEYGTQDTLLQNLRIHCTEVDTCIKGYGSQNDPAKVRRISKAFLDNWVTGQSSVASLTGISKFAAGNTQATVDADLLVLSSEPERIKNSLGYLASTAQFLGIEFGDHADEAITCNKNNIVNLSVFKLAVSQYIDLFKAFPLSVNDDNNEAGLVDIQRHAKHTQNFISKIQTREFFERLFLDYDSAINGVQNAIAAQVVILKIL